MQFLEVYNFNEKPKFEAWFLLIGYSLRHEMFRGWSIDITEVCLVGFLSNYHFSTYFEPFRDGGCFFKYPFANKVIYFPFLYSWFSCCATTNFYKCIEWVPQVWKKSDQRFWRYCVLKCFHCSVNYDHLIVRNILILSFEIF